MLTALSSHHLEKQPSWLFSPPIYKNTALKHIPCSPQSCSSPPCPYPQGWPDMLCTLKGNGVQPIQCCTAQACIL